MSSTAPQLPPAGAAAPEPENEVRLTFMEYTVVVDPPPVGSMVSVRVNRRRTKAMFDLRDPRVNRSMQVDAQVEAQRAADEERFRKKLDEQL